MNDDGNERVDDVHVEPGGTSAGGDDLDLARLVVLDPAHGREPSAQEWVRARAQLEGILATPGGALVPAARTTASAPGRARSTRVGRRVPAGPGHGPGRAPTRAPRAAGRRRWVAAGVAVAGAVVALNVAGSVVPSAQKSAFASWTASPQPQSASQELDRATACATAWAADEPTRRPRPVTADDVLLSDRRGPGAITLVRIGVDVVECQTMREGGGVSSATLTPTAQTRRPAPGGAVVDFIGYAGDEDPATVYSFATGRVGAGVDGVDVVTEDGRTVHASLRQGWWVAWWPGEQHVGPVPVHESDIVVRTAAGETRHDWRDLFVLEDYRS
ncbi:hypothetical protein [Kineococcus rubinsiae]|uniref:hypothetical protein n=1 Tax=Kineococcus rubinsiae TaxID=2609562 RepID=UPI00143077F2|nr:hypothetical protein [Kineococcus rubinsiae]NIZ91670.1 hypothetical protein [Kineococcus rubinsiae]